MAAFAPKKKKKKAEASSFLIFFLVVVVLLIVFSNFRKEKKNAQLLFVRWPKCKCPPPQKLIVCHHVFFFSFCMHTRIEKCSGFHLDLGDAQTDLINGLLVTTFLVKSHSG